MRCPVFWYTHLPSHNNRHHNLTPTLCIARDMPRELADVWHHNGFLGSGRCAAHAFPEADLLAGGLAVEWAQQEELVFNGGVCCRDDYLAAD